MADELKMTPEVARERAASLMQSFGENPEAAAQLADIVDDFEVLQQMDIENKSKIDELKKEAEELRNSNYELMRRGYGRLNEKPKDDVIEIDGNRDKKERFKGYFNERGEII